MIEHDPEPDLMQPETVFKSFNRGIYWFMLTGCNCWTTNTIYPESFLTIWIWIECLYDLKKSNLFLIYIPNVLFFNMKLFHTNFNIYFLISTFNWLFFTIKSRPWPFIVIFFWPYIIVIQGCLIINILFRLKI